MSQKTVPLAKHVPMAQNLAVVSKAQILLVGVPVAVFFALKAMKKGKPPVMAEIVANNQKINLTKPSRSAILNLKHDIPFFSIAYKNIAKNRKSQSLDL